jgi:hypothetical protein
VTGGAAGARPASGTASPDSAPQGREAAMAGWGPIVVVYGAYVTLSFLSGLAGGERQIVGAALFLGFMTLYGGGRLFPIPLSALNIALLFSIVFPALALASGVAVWNEGAAGFVVKYAALPFLILLAAPLGLTPLGRSPARRWGAGVLLGALVLGWFLRDASSDRLEGTFVNPNNYALAAMALFCFIDHERDPSWLRFSAHALVAGMIVASGTAGALLGYLCGLFVCLLRTVSGRRLAAVLATVALLASLALALGRGPALSGLGEMRYLGPLWTKVLIVREQYADVMADEDVSFLNLGAEYGSVEATSALWRLSHWRETLRVYRTSGYPAQLLGQGLGSSGIVLDLLPHNDYLRLLIEVGALGLLSYGAAWVLLYRRARPASRWVAVMMAVYAFTENNLDNFLVMSLFALFMVGEVRSSPPSPAFRGRPPGRTPEVLA